MPFFLVPQSFGDIVTAIGLASQIYNALSDSKGSSFEYQYLIDELDSFRRSLEFVDAATRTVSLSNDVIQDINAESARCRKLLEIFWDSIKSYHKALGGGKSGSSGSWRKIGWSVLKAAEIAQFREKLAARQRTLTLFLISVTLKVAFLNQRLEF
jgi:hypothetical protein